MLMVYVDGDACPVKAEVYRVVRRYGLRVVMVANAPLRVPADPLVELVSAPGFGTADDWIAQEAGPGDIVVTADIALALRPAWRRRRTALDPKGHPFTDDGIGAQLALRDLREELRQGGALTGGPSPMMAKDRSRFLSKLDEVVNAVRRANPKGQ